MSSLTTDQIYELIVKPLPAGEKLRLVEKIESDLKASHAQDAGDFWRSPTLDQLAVVQNVTRPCAFDDLLGGWPEDEKDDAFLDAVAGWRKEDVRRGDF